MGKRFERRNARTHCAQLILGALLSSAVGGAARSIAVAAPPADDRSTVSQNGYLSADFVYEKAPFPSCHASTIVELPGKHLLAAWFGGTDEGEPDVGIWISRHDGANWSPPVEVANGVEAPDRRFPCWNPVLYRDPQGSLVLFYKVGPNPSRWWGLLKRSADEGRTWSAAERLPDGILGPIKNKPVLLKGGNLLCGSSTEHDGWRVHLESTRDLGKTWEKTEPLNDGRELGLIQPTIFTHAGGKLQILCRSRQKQIVESWSEDGGRTWTPPQKSALVNPNSGIDGVTLQDGRALLVYNHTPQGRSPLNVAVSADGKSWRAALVLEDTPGEFSYPAVVQAADQRVHITYTWNRKKIRHVVVDPARLALREMPDGKWPK
jgi:predicted neuraminidase